MRKERAYVELFPMGLDRSSCSLWDSAWLKCMEDESKRMLARRVMAVSSDARRVISQ